MKVYTYYVGCEQSKYIYKSKDECFRAYLKAIYQHYKGSRVDYINIVMGQESDCWLEERDLV